jgi:hypothetical protein
MGRAKGPESLWANAKPPYGVGKCATYVEAAIFGLHTDRCESLSGKRFREGDAGLCHLQIFGISRVREVHKGAADVSAGF